LIVKIYIIIKTIKQEVKTMRDQIETINIIPSDYTGNPRDALGYYWANFADKIPGEDIVLEHDPKKGVAWIAYLMDRFGEDVEIHNHNNYGWLKDTPGQIIATFNCMWCGGVSGVVYQPHAGTTPPEGFDHKQTGDSLADTAAREKLAEDIDLMEMDELHKNHPGYCTKCHSFCYGDCEAN